MAKIVNPVWDMEKFVWTLNIEVEGITYGVKCFKDENDPKTMLCNFDSNHKKSVFVVADCIQSIADYSMIGGEYSSFKFKFNGKDLIVNSYPRILEQISKQVIEDQL